MNYETLIINTENQGVAIIEINRPKALNALNKTVFNELNAFFSEDYKQIDGLRGIIVTGRGEKAFVAGADITEFASLNQTEAQALSQKGKDIFDKISNFHLPVIAAVNGYALGGGCELAMACHLRWATKSARFGLPELSLGLIPGYSGTQRMVELVGKAKALELMLTGSMLDGDTACTLGLANHVSEDGMLIEDCLKVLSKISRNAPLAIKETIKTVNAFFDKNVNGHQLETEVFGALMVSQDAKEGAAAFLEKRKANFKGE